MAKKVFWSHMPNHPERYIVLNHECPVVGIVEVSHDWRFCPWCGCGLVRAIATARADNPLAAQLSGDNSPNWADI